MFAGPGGRGERFPNPQSVQEAMFHQGMGGEKGIPPGMMMDMQRMMGHQRGGMEPGNGMGIFPRMPGDGPMSPSSRLQGMGGREMGPEFGMGPGPGPGCLLRSSLSGDDTRPHSTPPSSCLCLSEPGGTYCHAAASDRVAIGSHCTGGCRERDGHTERWLAGGNEAATISRGRAPPEGGV